MKIRQSDFDSGIYDPIAVQKTGVKKPADHSAQHRVQRITKLTFQMTAIHSGILFQSIDPSRRLPGKLLTGSVAALLLVPVLALAEEPAAITFASELSLQTLLEGASTHIRFKLHGIETLSC